MVFALPLSVAPKAPPLNLRALKNQQMPLSFLQALSEWTSGLVSLFSLTYNLVAPPFPSLPDEVQAIATLIEKQAQIVVKPRMVSEEEKQRKAALLAQYADVTDEEEYPS